MMVAGVNSVELEVRSMTNFAENEHKIPAN